jgi:hypothetical protein
VEKIKITETRLEQYQHQIGKLRSWLTGWTDAGKTPPPGSEVLWQIDMMLKNKEAK